MTDTPSLVFIGKIVNMEPIPNADFILSATVICGIGGKWKGIVRKVDFEVGDECVVFLPDSQLNERDHFFLPFMKDSAWRVKMRRFKGAPSEVLIVKPQDTIARFTEDAAFPIGTDVTERLKVVKYHKPVPANLQGIAKGDFPGFIPKTDELNYQRYLDLVSALHGRNYYITEKADGSSTTAYRYKGQFGVCSRNYDLVQDENNGYWKVASKYQLKATLPDNIALQWETCGPNIQKNPMGLTEVDGFAFSAYDIEESRYLVMDEFLSLCSSLQFPTVKVLEIGESFDQNTVETLGEGTYASGKQREGVVVRSQGNHFGHKPVSFKVVNLNYEN